MGAHESAAGVKPFVAKTRRRGRVVARVPRGAGQAGRCPLAAVQPRRAVRAYRFAEQAKRTVGAE